MKRLVLDTCVIVSAFRSQNGASNALLAYAAEKRIIPLLSAALFFEYESVMMRPEQVAVHNLTSAQIQKALDGLASVSEIVNVNFSWRPQLRDPNDEMVLDLAVNGRADALITHNVRDFEPAAQSFGLKILTPSEFLKGMMQ